MLFNSEYEHSIDSKNRLAIPAEIRGRWKASEDGAGWFAVPWREGLIRLYTERSFEEMAQSRSLTLTPDEDEAELQATVFGLTARVEMDAAGRIRLPEELLKLVKLGGEVVLVGAGDRLEIRDRQTWRDSRPQRLAQIPELMKRIGAKRSEGGLT